MIGAQHGEPGSAPQPPTDLESTASVVHPGGDDPSVGEARTTEQLRVRTVREIAHRARTPLTIVLDTLRSQRRHTEPGTELHDQLAVADDQARRLREDVEALVELGAWSCGLDQAPGDVGELLESVTSKLRTGSVMRRVDVVSDVGDVGDVEFDHIRLRWAIDVFLGCAVEAIGRDDSVGVRCDAADDQILIRISNEGGPEAMTEHRRTERDLAVRIVELHGGRVEAGPADAHLTLTLPRDPSGATATMASGDGTPDPAHAPAHAPAATAADGATTVPNLEGPKGHPVVLVVEDDGALREYLERSLRTDYRVAGAADAEEAQRLIEQLLPDLIVCDLALPGGRDGSRLVKDLQQHVDLDDIPIIVITGRTDDDLRIRMLRDGADDYVTKPFVVDELQARIDNLLSQRIDLADLRSKAERAQQVAEQLQHALDSRVVIEQAKAFVAADRGISIDEAFEVLRSHSRANHVKLRELARHVVDGFRP